MDIPMRSLHPIHSMDNHNSCIRPNYKGYNRTSKDRSTRGHSIQSNYKARGTFLSWKYSSSHPRNHHNNNCSLHMYFPVRLRNILLHPGNNYHLPHNL